jgi:cytochrome c-type biogenesis protein CcmF
VLGSVATSAWQSERIVAMKPGEKTLIAGYTLEFHGIESGRGPNYSEDRGRFIVTRDGQPVTELHPAKRLYDAPRQPTTEAGIHVALGGDLYVVLGDAQNDGAFAVRLYFNPLVRFIWLGAVLMFIGGGLSLSDRRLRVGAPRKARKPMVVPAE